MTLCACGCGSEVNISKTYRLGHHVRINNPMSNPDSRAKLSGQNNPFYGKTHTDESKNRMSAKRYVALNRMSPEEIAKKVERMAEAVRGTKRSNEYKSAMSQRLKGVPKSKEHIRKVSETLKQKYATGELVSYWKGKSLPEETRHKMSEKAKVRTLSAETCEKIRAKAIGRRHSAETLTKMSVAQKGKKMSEIVKEKFTFKGRKHSEEAKHKMSLAHFGRTLSTEARKNISEAKIGSKNPMYGKSSPHPKKVFYEPRSIWLRSSWELAFAQHLDSQGIDWRYEETRYALNDGDMTYLPDFFIYEDGKLVKIYEVKGWLGPNSVSRITVFRSEYPTIPLEVIGREEFASIGIKV